MHCCKTHQTDEGNYQSYRAYHPGAISIRKYPAYRACYRKTDGKGSYENACPERVKAPLVPGRKE
jgi:hypothetical protein